MMFMMENSDLKKVKSKIDPWQDNKEAHEAINMCLEAIVKRLEQIESFVNELPTPDKTYYKPEGHKDYLNTKENYDTIYDRIKILEDKVYGMQIFLVNGFSIPGNHYNALKYLRY